MAKQTGRTCEKAYLKTIRSMDGDVAGRRAAADYLRSVTPGLWDGAPMWAANPAILDAEEVQVLEHAARMMGSIMEKVMAKYHRDRSFRALFGLSPEVERMTLVPSGCHAAVPLARVDLFFDRETGSYTVSGITTGAIEGVARAAEATRAVQRTGAYRSFAEKHDLRAFDPANELVLTLLHTYGRWANAKEGRNHPTNPALAVVDVAGSPRRAETDYVVERLRELGCYAHATDVSELRIESVGGVDQLVDAQGPVTCVWMRPTAEEAVENMERGVRTLLNATRRGLVCTIGGYRSWPCCTKAFMQVLRSRECRLLLTREENAFVDEHVDETVVIDTATDISRFFDQENWVIRLADGNRLGSVLAGKSMSRQAWRARLVKGIKRRDAVQRYIPSQVVAVVPGQVDETHPDDTMVADVITGLYVFEGRLGGIRAVCGEGNTTASWNGQMFMGCLELLD